MLKKLIIFFSLTFIVLGQGETIKLDEEIKEPVLHYNLILTNTLEEPSFNRLGNQTKATFILSLATVGILFALPEDFTGWTRSDIKHIDTRYNHNLGHRGMVWDPDNLWFNLVGHPYVGSIYYIAARKSGFDEFDSFLYSFAMSTFFWEMGVEGFAEAPSIQDIVITPGIGALLGEYLYHVEINIINNDGKIKNSRFLGKSALVLIDPVGTLANFMGYKDDVVKGSWTFVKGKRNESLLGYNISMKF